MVKEWDKNKKKNPHIYIHKSSNTIIDEQPGGEQNSLSEIARKHQNKTESSPDRRSSTGTMPALPELRNNNESPGNCRAPNT
jgi:hypothetical protein